MKKYLFLLILGLGLQACGGSETEDANTSQATSENEATPEEIQKEAEIIDQAPAETGMKAGKYCFKFADKTTTAFVDIELKADGTASGMVMGSVEDHENSYFTAYDMTLGEGSTWTAEGVDAKLTIEVDGDTQTEDQIWRFDGGHLMIREDIYTPADCSEKEKLFGQ